MKVQIEQVMHLPPTGDSVTEQRESTPKTDEVLIEEILRAAGLEALD